MAAPPFHPHTLPPFPLFPPPLRISSNFGLGSTTVAQPEAGTSQRRPRQEYESLKSHLKHCKILPNPPHPKRPPHRQEPRLHVPAGPGAAGVPLGSRQEKKKKKSFPKRKVACCSTVSLPPRLPPQDPKIPSRNSQGATWSGADPRRVLVVPPLPARGQVLRSWGTGRHRGAPNSAVRLGRQAHLSPAPPPASRWGCSSSSPAWCLLPGLAPGFARSLVAGCGARRASWLTPSGRSQHARGCSAGLGRRGDSPTHGGDAKRPAARLQVAGAPRGGGGGGWRPGPAARYAGREGGAGGGCLQPRWRGVAARPGDPSRPVQDRRAPGGGRRRELRAGAASLCSSSSSSPPSSPSSSLRRQQVGLGAAAAAQSSSGRAGPSCGLPGRLSPEPLPRDAREAGRARRGARAHTLHAPAAGLRGSPGPPGTEAGTPPRLRSPRPPLPGLPPQAGPAAQAVSAMTSMKQGAVSFPQVPPSRRSPPHPALPVAPSPKLRLAAPDSLTSPST